ncbi:hypothetical protein ACROYT_G023453 [Oculina patagonica]
MAPYSAEQLNYFKFAFMVLNMFPNALRRVFVFMWDNLFAHTPGCQKWDDSAVLRSMLLAKEGGKTKHIPTDKSYMKWDFAALFQATLFSKTFALSDGHGKLHTLYQLYVKPPPSGEFHDSVQSPTGNTAETTALALDQLRLLRNALCQMSTQKIDKTTFDFYMKLAKDALTALGQNSIMNGDTGKLTAEAFPTAKIQQLEFDLEREKSVVLELKQNVDQLPLLVEQELSDSYKECSNINSVVNPSLISSFKPSMHVSYFSYRLSSQRQAEFVFDYLICSLHVGKTLALTGVQDAVISSVQNEAFFIFQEPLGSNCSLSIVAEKKSVTVKCRTVSQSESKCICSSVRTALENTMESLPFGVSLSLKSVLQLPCEEIVAVVAVKRETSCSRFAPETWKSCACACGRDPEDVRGGKQSKAMSRKMRMLSSGRCPRDEANTKHADLGDDQVHPVVEPLWCILEYPGLDSSFTTSDVQASGSNEHVPYRHCLF